MIRKMSILILAFLVFIVFLTLRATAKKKDALVTAKRTATAKKEALVTAEREALQEQLRAVNTGVEAAVSANEKKETSPTGCTWGEFSPWGPCSENCGGGTQSRTREKHVVYSGGADCSDMPTETKDCNQQPCPIDCRYTTWNDWSPCSKSCRDAAGPGKQSRIRDQEVAKHGGLPCGNPEIQEKVCNDKECTEGPDFETPDWVSAAGYCTGRTPGAPFDKSTDTATTYVIGNRDDVHNIGYVKPKGRMSKDVIYVDQWWSRLPAKDQIVSLNQCKARCLENSDWCRAVQYRVPDRGNHESSCVMVTDRGLLERAGVDHNVWEPRVDANRYSVKPALSKHKYDQKPLKRKGREELYGAGGWTDCPGHNHEGCRGTYYQGGGGSGEDATPYNKWNCYSLKDERLRDRSESKWQDDFNNEKARQLLEDETADAAYATTREEKLKAWNDGKPGEDGFYDFGPATQCVAKNDPWKRKPMGAFWMHLRKLVLSREKTPEQNVSACKDVCAANDWCKAGYVNNIHLRHPECTLVGESKDHAAWDKAFAEGKVNYRMNNDWPAKPVRADGWEAGAAGAPPFKIMASKEEEGPTLPVSYIYTESSRNEPMSDPVSKPAQGVRCFVKPISV